jgi:hypothetical protein
MLEPTSSFLIAMLEGRGALLVLSILVGALVGMRFKVLSLVPITALGVAFIAANAFARDERLASALMATILVVVGLQLGYLCGAGIRFLWESAGQHASGSSKRWREWTSRSREKTTNDKR